MNQQCSKCSQQMQPVYGQDHLTCYGCNTFFFPPSKTNGLDTVQLSAKETGFLCPKCPDESLKVGTILSTQVACCGNCRGFVVDSGSFGFLAMALRESYKGPEDKPLMVDQNALAERTNCPACYQPMHAHPYHGPGNSVINSCVSCQLTWLDHGELGTIIRAPGQRGNDTTARESDLIRSKFNQQAMQGHYGSRIVIGTVLHDMFEDLRASERRR